MDLERLLNLADETTEVCGNCITSAAKRLSSTRGNELLFLHASLGLRLNNLQQGIQVLLRNRHPSDAAILALTLFEGRLDVLFVGDSIERAKEWMRHSNARVQPWAVSRKIKTVFKNDPRQQAQHQLYERLSQMKHLNPAIGTLGFGFRYRDGAVVITNQDEPDQITYDHCCFICHISSLQLAEATKTSFDVLCQAVGKDLAVQSAFDSHVQLLHALIEPLATEMDLRAAAETSWVTPSVLTANLGDWGPIGQ